MARQRNEGAFEKQTKPLRTRYYLLLCWGSHFSLQRNKYVSLLYLIYFDLYHVVLCQNMILNKIIDKNSYL
ncbi:hypothetical protein TSAR_008086 [Trichomalopsis sarcophagae]|uniref:Uncharacterized protein n=1 Tax=Trichomalopsis sarcophagae TaxID=543379 RepID=A0A232FNQ0_9HYME|nr:hypothetical protein TSAR_008086 [Trichomalopsis sarcophagae]